MLRLLAALLLLCGAPSAAQQPRILLQDSETGEPGLLLRSALNGPYHAVRPPAGGTVALAAGEAFGSSVLVLDGDAAVSAIVRGDLIVIGGDLFLRPGADIAGRAVAIGGGVYNSTLARVGGGASSFRDAVAAIEAIPGGFAVALRPRPAAAQPRVSITLPPLYGIRAPEYTRVDGLVLPWGPRIEVGAGALVVDPVITYRSDLGVLDPSLRVVWSPVPTWLLEATAQRATFSNDRWIRPDLVNSVTTLVAGSDIRNYFRADRYQLLGRREWPLATGSVYASLGARTERASSVAAGGPWSLFRRDSEEAMDRPNPPVAAGRISSALAGIGLQLEADRLVGTAIVDVEIPFETPDGGDWGQVTADAAVAFPTFGGQSFEFTARSVLTLGDLAPPQRWAYVGGSGTIPTLPTLVMGGDHLLFVESRYTVPVPLLSVPFVGPPAVSLQHVIGAAGPGQLPDFEQNVGFAIGLGIIELEVMVDPATGETDFSLGSRRVTYQTYGGVP